MIEDPLWRLRHALAGLALALLLSVLLAAVLGSLLGDALVAALAGSPGTAAAALSSASAASTATPAPADDGYTVRVTFYAVLLLHVIVGAVVLFLRVAQHETRPISAGRVLLWLVSLWCWPLLLLGRRSGASTRPDPPGPPDGP